MNNEVREALDLLQQKSKKASVAEIGGFRPPDNPTTSWFGGLGVGHAGESLPIYQNHEMIPLLQINVTELPYVPPGLSDIKLLILFMNPVSIPFDKPHGEGWLIREYKSLDDLVPLPEAKVTPIVRPFPVKWRLEEGETPGWEDAWDVVDLTSVNEDEEGTEIFLENMKNDPGTKVGGYPSEIQHGVGLDGYVFQVGSEEKPGWMWGDNGIGYFFKSDNTWRFDSQSY